MRMLDVILAVKGDVGVMSGWDCVYLRFLDIYMQSTMAALSKIWTVLARLNAGIVGSNPT
jgi:hypothetical protein